MAAIAATVASAGPVALVIAFTALASAAGCAESRQRWHSSRAWSAWLAAPEADLGVELDIFCKIGEEIVGPESTFATVLAEFTLSGKNLRRARSRAAHVLREPPRILPA